MTTPYEPEFTHNKGCAVGLAALPIFLGFIYFDERHAELAVGAFMAVVSTAVMAAERGTPFCPSKLRFASRQNVIRQGAWSYMLNKEPSERAAKGEEGEGYIPTTPIDLARVDAFLREHPGCCEIQPLRMSDPTISRAMSRAMFPNLTYVEVKARPQHPIVYFDVYKVDACWNNLARG